MGWLPNYLYTISCWPLIFTVQSLISNIEKIVINEIRKDLDPLSRSMDASNGWSVQLGYALDPETAPTWPDMSPIHSDYHRILRWYNKDTAMTFLRL